MASKFTQISDSALWLGLGIFLVVAVKQVSYGLKNIRSLTEIHNPSPPPTQLPDRLPRDTSHQEDAISTSSLQILATSPNIDIRASATKILCQRFYASMSARKRLGRDLEHGDDETKHRANLAFGLLLESGVIQEVTYPAPLTQNEGWRVQDPIEGGDGDAVTEQDLRRRRREAVVIHDGDRPIGQEDVIMRDQ